jgi:hypothetical protein
MNYDSEAILYKSADQQAAPRTGDRFNVDLVIDGTLHECVKNWLRQPQKRRSLFRLDTHAQEAFEFKIHLYSAEMLAIASREGFLDY